MEDLWFTGGLQAWYHKNKRELPWRQEKDAYRIWLSEVILQQTQIKQGLAYYQRFITHYPGVKQLAAATEDQVLKNWQGLGYYSRARNLHAAAKTIVKEHKGRFPRSYSEIRKLKGVGDYTAAAIASFAFNQPHAVVDGNVYRLLSRLFGLAVPIDSSQGKKQFAALAAQLLDKADPATHNQAIMEFGSQYCRPINPDCSSCIFSNRCFAFRKNMVSGLPVKGKRNAVKERHLHYLVLADKKNNILIRRREEKGIWQGLYEFSLLETAAKKSPAQMLRHKQLVAMAGKSPELLHISPLYKHMLSHQLLHARFYVMRTELLHSRSLLSAKPQALTKYAFPRLIEKFMQDCNLNELL